MESLEKENKALKAELKRLEKRSKVYFNNSDLAHIVLDNQQIIVDVNETFSQLFGYTKEEILSLHFSKLFTTIQLYQTWWKNYLNFNEFDSVSNLEYRLQKKNKFIFWAELFGKKFEDDEQEFSMWSVRDISLRVRSRNTIRNLNVKLQKQFEELSDILDIIPVPIFTKDKNLHYSSCNKAFCSFFEVTKEMVVGKTVYDLFPIELARMYQKKDEEMFTHSYQTYKVNVQSHVSKKDLVLEIHKKSLMREGEFGGFVGVFIDITQKEEQERYLQERIKEEVEKNLTAQARHQEEMIRNAKFASIGQMAAGITHEINTPLTYIKGNFEMLIEDLISLPHSSKKHSMLNDAEVIQAGLERIEMIIETMRGASQKSKEAQEDLNICDTLISALTISQNRTKQVVSILLGGVPFRVGDAMPLKEYHCSLQKQRIVQVWIVILNNALDELVKIENFDERSLHVDVFERENKVVVQFADNGGGIQPKILPRIFEPFESTKESSGIGIGLNIAKEIVIQNGGAIVAYNSKKGAIFEVSFPLVQKDA